MRSVEASLLALSDQASCFVRIRRHRVQHVRVTAELREAALSILLAMEHHGENRAPWLLVPDATSGPDRGWLARVERLRADHATRRAAFLDAGHPFGALALPDAPGALEGPVGAFGAMVRAYRHALPDFLDGLVVVLAPTRVERSEAWRAELVALVTASELEGVRFVLVCEDHGDLLDAPELAGLVRFVDCTLDPSAVRDDTVTLLASFEPGHGLGVAATRDHPPLRPTEEKLGRPRPARSAEASVTEAVLMAAARAEQGERARAIEWQIAACRRADAAERPDLAARARLLLAGMLQAAERTRAALGQYARAAEIAEGVPGLEPVAASARLAYGVGLWSLGRSDEALAELARAARLAEGAAQFAIAIAALRHAGQLAHEQATPDAAARAWARAVALAIAEPDAGALAGADDIRRQLAALVREHALEEATLREILALTTPTTTETQVQP
ncbi:MAG: hypothetical protein KF729_22570 [Sandaracinaceae bacterium]|nr:hypothetical protein [Sandaracinaceae bacterium]